MNDGRIKEYEAIQDLSDSINEMRSSADRLNGTVSIAIWAVVAAILIVVFAV